VLTAPRPRRRWTLHIRYYPGTTRKVAGH
jgi:hypothetical protein